MESNNIMNTGETLDSYIELRLHSLTIMPRPDTSRGLTKWFMDRLREDGYRGPTAYFPEHFNMVLILKPEGKPSQAERKASDEMLFSLFDTYTMERFEDGTALLIPKEQEQVEEGEEDEEADWDM
jgi:hypothetical protein